MSCELSEKHVVGREVVWFKAIENYHNRYTKVPAVIDGITKKGKLRLLLKETGERKTVNPESVDVLEAAGNGV